MTNLKSAQTGAHTFEVFACALWISLVVSTSGCSRSNAPGKPQITSQPASELVEVGKTAAFRVAANGAAPLKYQWQKNGKNIKGATFSAYRTPPVTTADSGLEFRVIIRNTNGTVTSEAASLTVISGSNSVAVLTYHNDNARTGQNLNEIFLTPANVNSLNFGKIAFIPVTGKVDAEPLYVSNLKVAGKQHNLLFVATEDDRVYAFDADTFVQLWQMSLLDAGETPSDDQDCGEVTPEIGITSTPVIDLRVGPHGTIFVAAMSKDRRGVYHQRLHALDITTGRELSGGPKEIRASYPGKGANSSHGRVIFDPKMYEDRASLLLWNGVVYTTWASHCDFDPYTGWVIGYDENTLRQTRVLNLTPNASEGSIWMSGAGPSTDKQGNIYLITGNGTFDTTLNAKGFPLHGDFGNSLVKIATAGSEMHVADYFTMHNTVADSNADLDFGSGGVLVLPDMKNKAGNTVHLAVGAGKGGIIYVVNRDSMGKFHASGDQIYQEIEGELDGSEFGMAAYFNHTVYFGAIKAPLEAYPVINARLATKPSSLTEVSFDYPGVTPSVSAKGTANAIVWAVENGKSGAIRAYDAGDLGRELYDSNQAGGRDQFSDNKFVTPMIANGKVYVGTPTGVIVFGLLP